MSFFQKIKDLFQAPPPRNPHGDWFYHTKIFSRKLLIFYRLIITNTTENKVLKTAEDILPDELAFNFTAEEVADKWGKPRCIFNNNNTSTNIKILFYRRDFVYENTLFQLQFFNNKLFFVCVEVGKSLATEQSKLALLNNMLPSYVTSNFKSVSSIPLMQDIHNNFLLIQDDVLLNICYISGEFAGDKLSLLAEAQKYTPKSKDEN